MRRKTQISVTLEDIALLCSVSKASVSAVLHGSRNIRVSAGTRERVLNCARKLNYVPPLTSFQSSSEALVGIWGASLWFSAYMISSCIRKNLLRNGYGSILGGDSIHSIRTSEESYTSPEELLSMGATSLIFLGRYSRQRAESLRVPFVIFGSSEDNSDIWYDKTDSFRKLTEHLLKNHGRKNPLFITVHSHADVLKGRWQQISEDCGLGPLDRRLIKLRDLKGDADLLFAEIARRGADCLIASNDYLGLRLMKAALQRGIRVPEDLAIAGHDGLSLSECGAVSLTTAMPPIIRSSEAICSLLYDRIQGRRLEKQSLRLEGQLRFGGSCGCKEHRIDRFFTRNTYPLLELDAMENFYEEIDSSPSDGS